MYKETCGGNPATTFSGILGNKFNDARSSTAAESTKTLRRQVLRGHSEISLGPIEDKILDLHATKRDLADNSLLERTDSTGRFVAEELLALIR